VGTSEVPPQATEPRVRKAATAAVPRDASVPDREGAEAVGEPALKLGVGAELAVVNTAAQQDAQLEPATADGEGVDAVEHLAGALGRVAGGGY
jgi:hypothetical protein